jgi:hypothetical protein
MYGISRTHWCVICVWCLVDVLFTKANADVVICDFNPALSAPIQSILCAVEQGIWRIPSNSSALINVGCLLGNKRCDEVMHVPTQQEIPVSPPPPSARNAKYQELATIAENVVPKTWWREGFANDKLLLSHSNEQLPRKQFDARPLSNKKLKNIYQCVTRQQFMRKSFNFATENQTEPSLSAGNNHCSAHKEAVVINFLNLWSRALDNFGGTFTVGSYNNNNNQQQWYPQSNDGGQLLMAASETLEYFFTHYGGVWTGCFAFEKITECRGALAAASLVVATHFIADVAGRKKSFTETQFVKGYILASLGGGLLHGDFGTTGVTPLTSWKVKAVDFIALQSAYLKLYIDSFGAEYSKQLNQHIPYAFDPGFKVVAKNLWPHLSQSLEPVYTSLRNWMFTEVSNLIDFAPYRPLIAYSEVRQNLLAAKKRRVLIDVGANGFFASPKFLVDSYAPYLPFTDVIMVEPEPHFSATVPPAYSESYNIRFIPIYAEVATGSDTDMLKLLPTLVTKDDFVVLKFDVDPNR